MGGGGENILNGKRNCTFTGWLPVCKPQLPVFQLHSELRILFFSLNFNWIVEYIGTKHLALLCIFPYWLFLQMNWPNNLNLIPYTSRASSSQTFDIYLLRLWNLSATWWKFQFTLVLELSPHLYVAVKQWVVSHHKVIFLKMAVTLPYWDQRKKCLRLAWFYKMKWPTVIEFRMNRSMCFMERRRTEVSLKSNLPFSQFIETASITLCLK